MWYGHFKYQVILFDLFNTPASFQGYVNNILVEKLIVFVIVYVDDILIYTKDASQVMVKAIWWVFEELRKHSFFAKLKKYCFHQ